MWWSRRSNDVPWNPRHPAAHLVASLDAHLSYTPSRRVIRKRIASLSSTLQPSSSLPFISSSSIFSSSCAWCFSDKPSERSPSPPMCTPFCRHRDTLKTVYFLLGGKNQLQHICKKNRELNMQHKESSSYKSGRIIRQPETGNFYFSTLTALWPKGFHFGLIQIPVTKSRKHLSFPQELNEIKKINQEKSTYGEQEESLAPLWGPWK